MTRFAREGEIEALPQECRTPPPPAPSRRLLLLAILAAGVLIVALLAGFPTALAPILIASVGGLLSTGGLLSLSRRRPDHTAELEAWHRRYDEASIRGADPLEALAIADAPPTPASIAVDDLGGTWRLRPTGLPTPATFIDCVRAEGPLRPWVRDANAVYEVQREMGVRVNGRLDKRTRRSLQLRGVLTGPDRPDVEDVEIGTRFFDGFRAYVSDGKVWRDAVSPFDTPLDVPDEAVR